MEQTTKQARKMTLVGEVISNKMAKTLVVAVERAYRHERLRKVVRSVKRYKAHFEGDERTILPGTKVAMVEGRPMSKTKFMYITSVIG